MEKTMVVLRNNTLIALDEQSKIVGIVADRKTALRCYFCWCAMLEMTDSLSEQSVILA